MNIKQFIKDYADKCAIEITKHQDELIRKGCNNCGIPLVENEKLINGARILYNPMYLLGMPLCETCYNRSMKVWVLEMDWAKFYKQNTRNICVIFYQSWQSLKNQY